MSASRESSSPRRDRIEPTARIRRVARGNPCRPGTGHHERYQLYRSGMTVQQYVARGGRIGDVRYDRDKGHIQLDD